MNRRRFFDAFSATIQEESAPFSEAVHGYRTEAPGGAVSTAIFDCFLM